MKTSSPGDESVVTENINQDEKRSIRANEPLSRPSVRRREFPAWVNGTYAGICLYFFVSAINVMGHGLKTLGKNTDWVEHWLKFGGNPVLAFLGGVVVTGVVQSSSFTTSLIITLVAVMCRMSCNAIAVKV